MDAILIIIDVVVPIYARDKSNGDVKFPSACKVKVTRTEDKLSSVETMERIRTEKSIKGRRMVDSSRIDDDYERTTVSRYRMGKATEDRASIEYQLSDEHFIELGWTVLPIPKTMSKIILYEAKPAKPHLDWFKRNQLNGRVYYDDERSIVFVKFPLDGSAEVFYPNGTMAIKVQTPNDRKYSLYTVFSPGGKNFMGLKKESQMIAVFDNLGNGTVFDEDGGTRLSYNQIGGIWRDNPTGIPLLWKWDVKERESITKTVFVEKSTEHLEKLLQPPKKIGGKSAYSLRSGKASASPMSSKKGKIEESVFEMRLDEDDESRFEIEEVYSEDFYHFKPIYLKLNEYMGLKISNRRNIALQFLVKRKSIRIELGTVLNLNKEVDSYFIDTGIKNAALKCKFEERSDLPENSSIFNIVQELKKIEKSAEKLNEMMDIYKPFLRAWKMGGTRCRPR